MASWWTRSAKSQEVSVVVTSAAPRQAGPCHAGAVPVLSSRHRGTDLQRQLGVWVWVSVVWGCGSGVRVGVGVTVGVGAADYCRRSVDGRMPPFLSRRQLIVLLRLACPGGFHHESTPGPHLAKWAALKCGVIGILLETTPPYKYHWQTYFTKSCDQCLFTVPAPFYLSYINIWATSFQTLLAILLVWPEWNIEES